MLVRNCGIRDIAEIENVSIGKVLSVLTRSRKIIQPKQKHYDRLEIDEFWTYVGIKTHKVWLIYAYHRETGEIVAWVWGKRDARTAKRLKKEIDRLELSYGSISTDDWSSFIQVFGGEKHLVGKNHTEGIEGNNCRLRYRIRRSVRKTCCFSKKLLNHVNAFRLVFFYINYGWI